jgi:uncharacterized LabA/DUF88 family protein
MRLVGSFTKIFSIAVLVAGDADFVPVVNEVKRHGVMVVVAASEKNVSADLKAAGDRFFAIGPTEEQGRFPTLDIGGRKWPAGQ